MYSNVLRSICVVTLCAMSIVHASAKDRSADFVIFSFDRPLQLYALLESTTHFITGLQDIFVIYRSSDDLFEQGYTIVKEQFPQVHYVQQSQPKKDFKVLTVAVLEAARAPYMLFGVDDIVVKDYVDIAQAIAALEEHNAYACYLRLSPLITYLYSWQREQSVPNLQKVDQGYLWQFRQASPISDWGYPHTVDMAIYRKKDIEHDFRMMEYYNPNSLESEWSSRTQMIRQYGFCYETSKIVNLPLNLVQDSHRSNPHMKVEELQPKQLLTLFLDGYKMDIAPIFKINNTSVHMEYNPTFIRR